MVKADRKLFVEGGGDSESLHTECRKGFRTFLERAGLKGKMPRIVSCGGRRQAVDKFLHSINMGEDAFLLIDSEGKVSKELISTEFLSQEFKEFEGKQDLSDKCHLMVECMEAWFLADTEALGKYFNPGFDQNKLPKHQSIESISKENLYKSLKECTKLTKTKGEYSKGQHSFKILALINPQLVSEASPWAKKFIDSMKGGVAIQTQGR